MFSRQIIDEELDIVDKADVQTATKASVSAIDGIVGRRENLLLNARNRRRAKQSFPAHTLDFLSNCFSHLLLYEVKKAIPESHSLESVECNSIQWIWTLC